MYAVRSCHTDIYSDIEYGYQHFNNSNSRHGAVVNAIQYNANYFARSLTVCAMPLPTSVPNPSNPSITPSRSPSFIS